MIINIGQDLFPSNGGIYQFIRATHNPIENYYSFYSNKKCLSRIKSDEFGIFPITLPVILALFLRNSAAIELRLHGCYSLQILFLLFIAKCLRALPSKILLYPHGMLYTEVVNSISNSPQKQFWNYFFFCLTSPKLTFVYLSESEAVKSAWIASEYPATIAKFVATPNINQKHVDNSLTLRSNRPFKIIMACRVSPEKQVYEVISSFLQLSLKDLELHIYGSLDCKPYVQLCISLANNSDHSNVFFHNYIDHESLLSLLPTFHCGVVYSVKENLSFSALEFAASGCIVITNKSVGAHEFLSEQYSFIGDSPSNIKYLNASIETLYHMKSEDLCLMSKKAAKYYAQILM